MQELAGAGAAVLSETPPAPTAEEMNTLFDYVLRHEGKVQVAEQVHLRPQHQAQLSVVQSGRIGRVSQAQLSVSHGYHGISLMRKFLDVGMDCPVVRGFAFNSPIVAGAGRNGSPEEERIINSEQDFMFFDYGDRMGVIDFTGDQYFGWIRNDRLLVRGERGEISGNECHYIKDIRTPLSIPLLRREGGAEGNLEGLGLQGITFGEEWVYRNEFAPAPLSDDELAVAACLLGMDRYLRTGEDFYSLADGCQDHYLNLCAQEAIASGKSVKVSPQAWS